MRVSVYFLQFSIWMLKKAISLFHTFEKDPCREAYKVWFGNYPPHELGPIMAKPQETYWAWLPDFFPYVPLPRWVRSKRGGGT